MFKKKAREASLILSYLILFIYVSQVSDTQ